jgi:hypothetical protein
MTPVSMWLLGLLGIASVLISYYLIPIVRLEYRSDERWWRNKAFRLSFGLWVHSFGAVDLIVATIVARVQDRNSLSLYLLWSAWALWIIAKNIIVAVVGRWEMSLALSLLWTAIIFATRFHY